MSWSNLPYKHFKGNPLSFSNYEIHVAMRFDIANE